MKKKLLTSYFRIFILKFLMLFIVLFITYTGYSQDTNINLNIKNLTLKETLNVIEKQTDFTFFYNNKKVNDKIKISVNISSSDINTIINKVLKNTEYKYKIDDKVIIISKNSRPSVEIKVQGKIVDVNGVSLPGVNVVVKGTLIGSISNDKGMFSISCSSNAIFEVSYIGYSKQLVDIDGRNSIEIILIEDAIGLDEVLVVGYGTIKKSNSTGAIGTLKAKDLDKKMNSSIGSALQGKIAGVSIESSGGAPGSGAKILIRGAGSLTNNNPLYIVDGVPFEDINSIAPSDIKSIQVLKDASSAAIYGSRAANGVILISTKSGSEGGLRIDYNADFGVKTLSNKLDVLTTDEWIKVNNMANEASGKPHLLIADNPQVPGQGVDWQDEIYRNSLVQNHSIGLSGGSKDLVYNLSLGYLKNEGIIKTTDYTRINIRLKTEFTKGRLRIGETIIISKEEKTNMVSMGGQGGPAVTAALMMIPAYKIYDKNAVGGYAGATGPVVDVANPLAQLNLLENEDDWSKIFVNLFAELDIVEGLKFKINGGYRSNKYKNFSYNPIYKVGTMYSADKTSVSYTLSTNSFILIENTLSYKMDFGKHYVNLLAGNTYQKNSYERILSSKKGMPKNIFVLDAGTSDPGAGGIERENLLLSYFGRANYSFDDKYIVSFSVRRDGSSRFNSNNRFGVFPAASFAWNIHKENFLKNKFGSLINELKFRIGYGELGNQEIGDYKYLAMITPNVSYSIGNRLWNGSTQINFPATNIKWESTSTGNVGIDLSLLKNKFVWSLDMFKKTTEDLLLNVPIPYSAGANSDPIINAGKISNTGFETSLTYNGKVNDFSYSITGTLSSVTNKIEELSTGTQIIAGASASHHPATVTYAKLGKPLFAFFVIHTDGIFNSEEEVKAHTHNGKLIQKNASPGDIRFVDANNDGKIDAEDKVYSGSPFPDFEYGIRIDCSYKSFDFGIFFQGTQGNKIINGLRTINEGMNLNTNYSTSTLNAWTPEKHTDFPRAILSDPNLNARADSDRFLEDGSYFRLKTIQLGYTLGEEYTKSLDINKLRFYLGAENIFTITNYSGYNPDIGGHSIKTRGVDYRSYPIAKSIHFGIQLMF